METLSDGLDQDINVSAPESHMSLIEVVGLLENKEQVQLSIHKTPEAPDLNDSACSNSGQDETINISLSQSPLVYNN